MEKRSFLRIVTEDDEPLYIDEWFKYNDLLKVVGSEYFWAVYEDDRMTVICNGNETTVTIKEKDLVIDKYDILDKTNIVENVYYKLHKIVKQVNEAGEAIVDWEKSYEK